MSVSLMCTAAHQISQMRIKVMPMIAPIAPKDAHAPLGTAGSKDHGTQCILRMNLS